MITALMIAAAGNFPAAKDLFSPSQWWPFLFILSKGIFLVTEILK